MGQGAGVWGPGAGIDKGSPSYRNGGAGQGREQGRRKQLTAGETVRELGRLRSDGSDLLPSYDTWENLLWSLQIGAANG